jgi:MFS family permease
MGLSAACRVYEELILCRFFAGLGIGGILSCAMVLVSEYAPDNRKSTASFLYTAGYSFGATLGGALAASAAQQWGWRVAFACGALGSVLLFPVAFAFLPESDSYRRAAASKFDFQACRSPREWAGPAVLLRQQAGMTLLLWVAFFLAYAGYYFVVSWTPKILVLGGLSTQAGMNAGVLLSLGGLGGTLLFALLGGRVPVRWLLLGCLASSALAMLIFPEVAQGTSLAFGAAIILGATTTNAMASFYALTPRLYGPLVRSAGMGWAVGVGRIGAIAAPFAAGILLDAGWTTAVLFRLFGIFLGLAALVSQLLPGDRVEGLAATHPTDAARDLAR